MSPRIERRTVGDASALPAAIHPVLRRVYAARGVTTADALDDSLASLAHWDRLGGIEAAADRLAAAIERQDRVVVVGDFDADGATACALACSVLHAAGARTVEPLVPNRFEYGYGLTPEIVALAHERHAPGLIVTVDNGISSHAGIAAARARGVAVIVTDHHLPGVTLPDADAIVNPNLPGDAFPSKSLAGVGVVFYLMLALRDRFAGAASLRLADWLDLVAVGTVADVVTLDTNNRILVAQGLKRIRAGRCRPGLTALLRQAGRDPAEATATDIAFAVAPRLNAAGRLEDMSLGIACLLTDDAAAAAEMAARLDSINRERREIEHGMHEEALKALARLDPGERDPVGVCLFDPGWHEGVIGILAGRVKERLHRPVVAFARTAGGGLKGSARSIPGFHIRDALDTIAARHPDLLHKFGGHAMAAGLSLAEPDLEAFRTAFDAVARERIPPVGLARVLMTDGELGADEIGLDLATLLREAGPWGQGFPEPMFDGTFEVVERRIVGERHLKMRVRPVDSRHTFDAIHFRPPDAMLESRAQRVRLVYKLDVNEWRGKRSVQLVVEHAC